MPHDCKGNILNPGDVVLVPFKIKDVHQTEDYCNVNLETVATMGPEHKFHTSLSAINTKMMLKYDAALNLFGTIKKGIDGVELI